MNKEQPAHPVNLNDQSDSSDTIPIKQLSPRARKRLTIWLFIGPALLFLAGIILNVTVNTIVLLSLGTDSAEALIANPPLASSIVNTALQATTTVSLLTFLPSLAAAITLLVTRQRPSNLQDS